MRPLRCFSFSSFLFFFCGEISANWPDLAEAQADRVGPVRAAGGEDAHAVAVEAGRVDQGLDGPVAVIVEDEEHPDMGEAVQPEHGVRGVAE